MNKYMEERLSQVVAELRKVTFQYAGSDRKAPAIFGDFSMKFEVHGMVTLLGPSGCGKSTLLGLLARLLEPLAGEVWLDRSCDPIGYMFQEYPFLPRKTVLEHISFPLRMRGNEKKKAIEIAQLWLDRVMLSNTGNLRIDSLSVGMKARVALCTTMVNEPRFVLLDEPFHALDIETRVRMWQILREIWSVKNTAGLLVTHDLTEAIVLGSKIVVLSKPPCRVLLEIDSPFSITDSVHGILESPAMGDIHQKLWRTLQTAIDRGNRK